MLYNISPFEPEFHVASIKKRRKKDVKNEQFYIL